MKVQDSIIFIKHPNSLDTISKTHDINVNSNKISKTSLFRSAYLKPPSEMQKDFGFKPTSDFINPLPKFVI